MSEIASGWYKDPADPTTQRYWDGEVWIGDPLPADATPPDGPPTGSASVPERGSAQPRTDAASGSLSGSRVGERSAAPDSSADRPGEPTAGWPPPAGWSPPRGWPTPPESGEPGQPPHWAPPNPDQPPTWAPPNPDQADGGQPGHDQPGHGQQSPGQPGGPPPQGWPPTAPGASPQGWPPHGSPQQIWPPQSRPPRGWPVGQLPPGVHLPPNGQMQNPPPGWPTGAGYPYVVVAAPRPHGMALASLGRRFAARLIDIAAVGVLSAILTGYLVYQWWQETSPYWHQTWQIVRAGFKGATVPDVTPTMTSRGSWLSVAILLLVMGIWLVYEVPNIASSGQTPGKRLMGIRVVGLEATTPIGVRRAIRRWMPLGLPILVWTCGPLGVLFGGVLQLINCLSPTINRPLRLALHDRRAFTVVVQAGSESDPEHPESGSMANSTVAGHPGNNGRNDARHGGHR